MELSVVFLVEADPLVIPARKVVSTLLAIMRARPNKRGFIVSGIVDLRHKFNLFKGRVSDLMYELKIMYISHQCIVCTNTNIYNLCPSTSTCTEYSEDSRLIIDN